jgi:triphosphoribosyl-dephospho-CoA synthase
MEFDTGLKQRSINPGTSADLTVACLLVHNLRSELA